MSTCIWVQGWPEPLHDSPSTRIRRLSDVGITDRWTALSLKALERVRTSSPTKKSGGNFGGNYFFGVFMSLFINDFLRQFGGRHLHQIMVRREPRKVGTPYETRAPAFF